MTTLSGYVQPEVLHSGGKLFTREQINCIADVVAFLRRQQEERQQRDTRTRNVFLTSAVIIEGDSQ